MGICAVERERELSKTAKGGSNVAGARSRVTLADIAAAAGVSVTTASNVVNGRLEMMSAATRERVERAMRRLKYRPDDVARSLRLAQKRSIGLMVIDDSPRFLTDAMNTNIIAGFSNYPQREWLRLAADRPAAQRHRGHSPHSARSDGRTLRYPVWRERGQASALPPAQGDRPANPHLSGQARRASRRMRRPCARMTAKQGR